MNKTDSIYLGDILKAISTIESYVKDIDLIIFKENQMRHDATIRQLEILGEAANKLSPIFRRKYPDFPLRQAVSMRNFLIHGYDDIDLEIVWNTIHQNLADLKLITETIKIRDFDHL